MSSRPREAVKKSATVGATPQPSSPRNYAGGGVETEDGRTLFGFDAECYLKLKSKEDPEWERTVGNWINLVLAPDMIHDPADLWTSLKDGLVLCMLMNKLRPGTIPKYSTKNKVDSRGHLGQGQLHPLMERENITLYLEACWKVGVNSDDMFNVADLHSRKGMQSVLTNLSALSNMAPIWGFPVPGIGIKSRPLPGSGAEKQPSKWTVNLPTGPVYTEEALDGDEVEVMENELNALKQQLEESQRTISKLDVAKNYLAEQLKVERKRLTDSDREIQYMNGSGKGGKGSGHAQFIDDLKKSRDEIQKELSALKREIGSGLNLASLRKELEETKKQQKELEDKLLGLGDIVQIQKLQSRLAQLTAENMSFLSQAVAGSGMDAATYLKKIETLEEEKTNLISSYDKKIQELNVKIAAVEDECLKTMWEFQEEKEQEFDQQCQLRAAAEEDLRVLKQSNAAEAAKFQSEIEDLKIEKGFITHEFTVQKASLEQQIASIKSQIKTKVDEITKEAKKIKKLKDQLVNEQKTRKVELENALEAIKKKHAEQLDDYKRQVQKLCQEKAQLSEKAFAEQRKLQQELFQKSTELQIAQKKAEGGAEAGTSDDADSGLVDLERAHLASANNYEKEKLLQEKMAAVDSAERALLDERRISESLQNELTEMKERMQARFDSESQRIESELGELLAEAELLESQIKDSKELTAGPLKELQEKMAQLTAQTLKEKIQLENRIRELELETTNSETSKEALKQRLTGELTALQTKLTTETQKYKEKIEQMEKTTKQLLADQEAAKEFQAKNSVQAKTLVELQTMRQTMDFALQVLNGNRPGLNLEALAVPTLLEAKAKMLEAELAKLKRENEANKPLMAQLKKLQETTETQLKELRAKLPAPAPAPVPEKVVVPVLPADKNPTNALSPEKAALRRQQQEKLARQNNRKSTLLYLEKNTVEQDMQKLTDCIETLMLGEAVAKDAHQAFKGLFKLDNGRRLLCFSLHEASSGCEPGEPFLMSLASFELLKWMVNDVMNNLNLSEASDQISGRLLLECSLLIGRESKKGKEPELLQAAIKPHRVWLNTFFWEEYFWTQVTPKFEELNIESKQDECAFFKVEIVEFAKRMLGWGNLGTYAIGLFVESLADKCDLGEATKAALVKEIESSRVDSGASATKKPQERAMGTGAAHRRTLALSHAQIQEALKNPGSDGASWETMGDELKGADRQWPRGSDSRGPAKPGAAPGRPSARPTGSLAGAGRGMAPIPAFAGQRPGTKPTQGTSPAKPASQSPGGPKKAATDDFQMSRRRQVAKTVQLTSNGFLANLSQQNQNNFGL